ncbi:hypothetical protein CS542_00960 [Pedobacter sp. IW39]|nr:hypothetical protein CS542_00960 [Pedobacter sp. IW39]
MQFQHVNSPENKPDPTLLSEKGLMWWSIVDSYDIRIVITDVIHFYQIHNVLYFYISGTVVSRSACLYLVKGFISCNPCHQVNNLPLVSSY